MNRYRLLSITLVLALAALACSNLSFGQSTQTPGFTATPLPTPTPAPVSAIPAGPVKITGTFNYSNDIITTYFAQQAVALTDMHGFVARDLEWEIPVESQTLGFLDINTETMVGAYFIDLPAKPEGTFDDVDNSGSANAGVQIFAVAYSPNLTGGPYSEGDDRSFGWPTYLASVKADSENKDEVIGGKLVVWAPDNEQQFPTGFGDDGLLFTADDPAGPIPAGYSIVDLDQKPFGISQEAEPQVELYEPKEAAIKDYSGLSYTEAFDELFKSVSTNWAFNGMPGKEVDWKALHDELAPRVAQAEKDKDALAFYQAIHDFTLAIPDGHTGVSGGDLGQQDFQARAEGGYGFAIRELDDGRVIVVFVTPGGPAEAAGMAVGAEVTGFNGQPIKDAIGKVKPYAGPFSLESSRRYQQTRYLLRGPVGVEAEVAFANPGGKSQTVTLASVPERDSFFATSIYRNAPNGLLPVDYRVLDSGVGYVAINSYYDDLSLIITLFERALKQFQGGGITNLIIDLRYNGGGNPLGLAGFLYDQEIPLGQQESFSEQTGQFEPVGVRDRVLPNKNQYHFDKIAILVGPACASACEQEAYSFSQAPGAIVVGAYPSGGIFADVLRGQYVLPEGISIQIPTERFTNPDGSLFLEGT
ncbi:MAG: S41 family peptidase, partial [Chloroflexota bacterium]